MKEFLRGLQILSGLSDQELEPLVRTAKERRFRADERIVRKDEPGTAAYILKEGAAEALYEKPGAEPLHLSKVLPGDLFGELALFDDSPRSATVVATTDCSVVEIRRDAFLQEIARNPEAALKLLSVVAKRLRRAESVVSDFSNRIYGDVLPRLQETVSAQLDSAKIICEESRKRAESTIEQAKHLQDTTDQHWANLVRMGSVVGVLILGGGALATFFGFDKIDTVVVQELKSKSATWEQKLSEVNKLKSETETLKAGTETYVQNVKEKINNELRDLEVVREIAREFDKMRRDLQLGNGAGFSAPPEVSGEMARDFVAARQNLMKQYFERPTRWESEILVEALDLLVGTLDRRYMAVNDKDWDFIIDAVAQALKSPPDHWRQRLKLSEMVVKLYGHMVDSRYQRGARALIGRMEALLESGSQSPDTVSQIATLLAKFGTRTEPVKAELRKLQSSDSRWRRSQAAIDLISLGEAEAWATLRKGLAGQFEPGSSGESEKARRRREGAAFAAAHLIAQRAAERDIAAQRYFSVEALDTHLGAERLAQYLNPWPEDARAGADLVGQTIHAGLTGNPGRWNRFYWQYSCDLLCNLGCKSPEAADGGKWCRQCLDELESQYSRGGVGADRSGESCNTRSD